MGKLNKNDIVIFMEDYENHYYSSPEEKKKITKFREREESKKIRNIDRKIKREDKKRKNKF